MEDLDKAIEEENKRFWDQQKYTSQSGAILIAIAIRWAAIVIVKEIRNGRR